MTLQTYLNTLEDKAYVSALNAEDYRVALKVPAEAQKPAIKNSCNVVKSPRGAGLPRPHGQQHAQHQALSYGYASP